MLTWKDPISEEEVGLCFIKERWKMKELIAKAAEDLVGSKYAIALTGAGISTESGVPDFRGPSGIWTKDPEAEKRAYRSYEKFRRNPKEYWQEILAGPSLLGDLKKAQPNPGHLALMELEKLGILKWVITQNIDNLHQRAGNQKVLDYHGNISKLRCVSCETRYDRDEFDLEQLRKEDQLPPLCKKCRGVVKSDVVHFNEGIPSDVANASLEEAEKCDLMLICGTSATVYPFAHLPRMARRRKFTGGITIVEINAEPTPLTEENISDYLIQGKTGQILPQITEEVKRLHLLNRK